jgi:hypothetical protein
VRQDLGGRAAMPVTVTHDISTAGAFPRPVVERGDGRRSDETNNAVRRSSRHHFPGKRRSDLWDKLARSGMSQSGVLSPGMARRRNRAVGRRLYRLESTRWPSLERGFCAIVRLARGRLQTLDPAVRRSRLPRPPVLGSRAGYARMCQAL